MQTLVEGAILQNGKYKILEILGQGGFGITYLALQTGLERKVAVKEFFIKDLCERNENTSHVTLGTEGSKDTVNRFREKFLKEARNIARFDHPNIIRVIDVFEENGTAYYVMEYAEKGSLADKVKREGYLSESVSTRYILQLAEALEHIHKQKMNHLDVKPANILINGKDEAVLIDFGLSKQYDVTTGNQTSSTPVGISEGYAPIEQYKLGGVVEFSPETDIYALGATFFKLLTGMTPPSATDVYEDGVPVDVLKSKGVSENAISAICMAMKGRKKDRINDAQTFIDLLTEKEVEAIEVSLVKSQLDDVSTNQVQTESVLESVAVVEYDAVDLDDNNEIAKSVSESNDVLSGDATIEEKLEENPKPGRILLSHDYDYALSCFAGEGLEKNDVLLKLAQTGISTDSACIILEELASDERIESNAVYIIEHYDVDQKFACKILSRVGNNPELAEAKVHEIICNRYKDEKRNVNNQMLRGVALVIVGVMFVMVTMFVYFYSVFNLYIFWYIFIMVPILVITGIRTIYISIKERKKLRRDFVKMIN